MPALFLWAAEGKMDKPGIAEITIIALLGGLLGVFFMVPLRNALIVKEHGTLPYPEGTACAKVLLAGEEGGANASTVFAGLGIAAGFKLFIDGLKIVPSEVNRSTGKRILQEQLVLRSIRQLCLLVISADREFLPICSPVV